MINQLTLITYTHSSRLNFIAPYFDRIKKYFSDLKNNLVVVDICIPGYDCVLYKEHFSTTMAEALSKVRTKYVIFSHEDYILYDFVKIDRMNKFLKYMEQDNSILFIRLIQSGIGNPSSIYNEDLGIIDKNSYYLFSNQVSIWRKEVLLEVLVKANIKSLWDEPLVSTFLKNINGAKLYDLKRGSRVGSHYNSYIYPYIATATVKGQWNIKEYPKEIKEFLYEYKLL